MLESLSVEKKEMPRSWLLSSGVLRVRSPSLALRGQFHDVNVRCADKEAEMFGSGASFNHSLRPVPQSSSKSTP